MHTGRWPEPYGSVVSLARDIVDRRGGVLIHGTIIARELGTPCVNGTEGLLERLVEGEAVMVDGHSGIVTVGPLDFYLESVRPVRNPERPMNTGTS